MVLESANTWSALLEGGRLKSGFDERAVFASVINFRCSKAFTLHRQRRLRLPAATAQRAERFLSSTACRFLHRQSERERSRFSSGPRPKRRSRTMTWPSSARPRSPNRSLRTCASGLTPAVCRQQATSPLSSLAASSGGTRIRRESPYRHRPRHLQRQWTFW